MREPLGRLLGVALGWWYTNGNMSFRAPDVYLNDDEWREKYWAGCLASQTTKLEDWAYEQEYRLILQQLMTDYSDPRARKLKYKFSDLKGIVFGIETPEQDKLEIR